MLWSIQVHQNHPKASLEAGASNVLSGSGRLSQVTTASSPLSKDPHCLFELVRGKKSSVNTLIFFYTVKFAPHKPKHTFVVFDQNFKVSGRLTRAWKHIRAASLYGCLRVVVVNLDALEDKFAANSLPETDEETQLWWTLMPVNAVLLFSFIHSTSKEPANSPIHEEVILGFNSAN